GGLADHRFPPSASIPARTFGGQRSSWTFGSRAAAEAKKNAPESPPGRFSTFGLLNQPRRQLIGIRTRAPPTGAPSRVWGRIWNREASCSVARPKPAPEGLSLTTLQSARRPFACTVHSMVAEPSVPSDWARLG